ncbi:MAG: hypothetical protein AAF515_17660 [Pseudomonadota bacterium]
MSIPDPSPSTAPIGAISVAPWRQIPGATAFEILRVRHRPWADSALASLALAVLCLLLSALDTRSLHDVSVWSKPAKFALSMTVLFGSLAWFARELPDDYFARRTGSAVTQILCWSAWLEMLYICVQAARGEASHYNDSSELTRLLYGAMAWLAIALVAACAWLGAAVLRHRGTAEPYAFGVGLGLLLTCALGGGFGLYLGSQGGHWVGAPATDSGGLPLVGWSRAGGDLRVAHFFGIHALQALPLIGWGVARLRLAHGDLLVLAAALVYTAFTAATFVQAVAGRPFL